MEINKLDIAEFRRYRIYKTAVVVLFTVLGGLAAVDLAEDLEQGTTLAHLVIESLVVLLSLIAALTTALILIRDSMEMQAANRGLLKHLELSREATEAWKNETHNLLIGLGASINRQFDAWQLTSVEKDIALFLLKGLSHKEVAHIREVSDATVRQQARAVYRKAGVIGRHGLAAFFLEDLALPVEAEAVDTSVAGG